MNENIKIMENNNSPKKNKGLIVIIILLIIALLGTIGYILYDKGVIFSNKNNTEVKQEEKKEETKKEEQQKEEIKEIEEEVSLSNSEKEDIDMFLNTFNFSLYKNDSFNKELLDNYNSKFNISWLIIIDSLEKEMEEICTDGQEATGCARLKLSSFNNKYKELYGEEFDIVKLDKTSFNSAFDFPIVKNNYIYSNRPALLGADYYTLNRATKSNDIYTIYADKNINSISNSSGYSKDGTILKIKYKLNNNSRQLLSVILERN